MVAPRYRSLVGCALLVAGVLAPAWIGRRADLIKVGRLLVAEDPVEPVQVLVVSLAQPASDALEAARLYHEGVSATIVLPTWEPEPIHARLLQLGIPDFGPTELALTILERSAVPSSAVEVLPSIVDGTATEIAAIVAFARQRQPESLLFVGARSHSARVRWFLRRELPVHTRLIVHSPANDWFTPESWWHSRAESREVLTEYLRWVNMLMLRDPWSWNDEAVREAQAQ